MNFENSSCPCGDSEAKDIQRYSHARLSDGRSIFGWTATCEKCKLPLQRTTKGNSENSAWFSTQISVDSVTRPVEKDDLERIDSHLSKYKTRYKKWKTFLAHLAEEDELFFFDNQDSINFGILMVRNSIPVLDFGLHISFIKKLI